MQSEPIVFKEDIMVKVHLLDTNLQVNEELLDVNQQTAAYFGLSSVEDLGKVTEQGFSAVFTPLINTHYRLR